MAEGGLLGRSVELARIAAMVATIPDGARSLTLVGEAGIGKTSVWSAAIVAATDGTGAAAGTSHLTVRATRAVEAERGLSNVVLTDLLAPLASMALAELPGPQRAALSAALLLDDDALGEANGQPGDTDPRALGMAVLGVLRHATVGSPLLLAIDDVAWVDAASAAALAFALRRAATAGLPIGLLLTERAQGGLSDAGEAGSAVGRQLADALGEAAVRLTLGPASLGVLHNLIRDRAGATLTRPELIRLEQASGGNPMLAIEMARELARLDRWPMPGEPLPVPADTRALLARRLERLAPGSLEILWCTAAMSSPTSPDVARASDRPLAEVEAAVDGAVQAGLLERLDPSGRVSRLRFGHPLIAATCLDALPMERRRALHRRLAEQATADEERGRHVALATDGPDPVAARHLDAAATAARRRGAPGVAAAWAEAAASVTPTEAVQERVERQLRAARWWTDSGDVERGRAALEAIVATAPPGDQRADARALLAQIAGWEGGPTAILEHATAALDEARDPELRARILLRISTGWDDGPPSERAALAGRAVDELRSMTDGSPDPALLACAMLQSAAFRFEAGLADDEAAVRAAVALLGNGPHASRDADQRAESHRAHALVWEWADDHDRSDAALDGAFRDLERAHAHGLDRALPIVESEVSLLLLRAGRTDDAVAHAQAAAEAAAMAANHEGRRAALSAMAAVLAARGELDEADRLIAQADAAGGATDDWLGIRLRAIEASVALVRGDATAAVAILGPILDAQVDRGRGETLQYRFAGDLVEAAIAAGDVARARQALAVLDASVVARPRPWVRLMAARCRALVAAATGDLEAADGAIRDALEVAGDLPIPMEHARTELIAGRIARRRKERRRAAGHLGRAIAGFDAIGAMAWRGVAEAEMARLGRRAGAPDALTETELQVARLAASGLTSREVGEAAFLTAKSVEGVLARVYQKLGIRSRAELGAWLTSMERDSPVS